MSVGAVGAAVALVLAGVIPLWLWLECCGGNVKRGDMVVVLRAVANVHGAENVEVRERET